MAGPGFPTLSELHDAMRIRGQRRDYSFHKTIVGATGANNWVDLNFAAGLPAPQYYASEPLVAATLNGRRGLFHGDAVTPARKFLWEMSGPTNTTAMTALEICDYLLYYPFIDMSLTGEEQTLDNTVTLPRYETGEGVQIVVVQVFPQTGSSLTFSIRYTNSQGVTDRVTQTMRTTAVTGVSGIVANAYGSSAISDGFALFAPRQAGDTGVRSVEGFTVLSGTDTGLVAVVLVKPVATIRLAQSASFPWETTPLIHQGYPPEFHDNAFLSGFMLGNASTAGAIRGMISTVWN